MVRKGSQGEEGPCQGRQLAESQLTDPGSGDPRGVSPWLALLVGCWWPWMALLVGQDGPFGGPGGP